MYGSGVNPIFFHKKIKIRRTEHSLPITLPTSDNILFLPYSSPPQSGRHICITPILDVWLAESVAQMCSVKKVFLEISQDWQENTCARVYFLIKLRCSREKI